MTKVITGITPLLNWNFVARLAITKDTLRALFAKSGNLCAFPGCSQNLITEKNLFVAQICHIEAATDGGERFNPQMTDDQRRHFDNLLLLCYPHHVETNDIVEFPVSRLKTMKYDHENRLGHKPFKIDESKLFEIISEFEKYWADIEKIAILRNSMHEYPIELNTTDSFFKLLAETQDKFVWLRDFCDKVTASNNTLPDQVTEFCKSMGGSPEKLAALPYYENPFFNKHWEAGNIGVANVCTDISVKLAHIELKYLEE